MSEMYVGVLKILGLAIPIINASILQHFRKIFDSLFSNKGAYVPLKTVNGLLYVQVVL